jgi:hypothetical protein
MVSPRTKNGVRSAVDPEVHALIVVRPDEQPDYLACPTPACAAYAKIDADPATPGWQELEHDDDCPYRTD